MFQGSYGLGKKGNEKSKGRVDEEKSTRSREGKVWGKESVE